MRLSRLIDANEALELRVIRGAAGCRFDEAAAIILAGSQGDLLRVLAPAIVEDPEAWIASIDWMQANELGGLSLQHRLLIQVASDLAVMKMMPVGLATVMAALDENHQELVLAAITHTHTVHRVEFVDPPQQ